jgi:hypothetical protein
LHNGFQIVISMKVSESRKLLVDFGKYTFGSNDLENRDYYYIGEYKDNQFDAKGRMVRTDGKLYDGEWGRVSSLKLGGTWYNHMSLH